MEAPTTSSSSTDNLLSLINVVVTPILITLAFIIILLNSSLGYIIAYKVDIRNSEIKLIGILCIIELFIGFDILTLSLCKLIFGYKFFKDYDLGCQIFGFTMQAPTRAAMIINALLAILRYLAICKKREKSSFIWLAIFILFSLPIIGLFLASSILGDAKVTSSLCQCHGYLGSDKKSKIIFGIITLYYLIPCWLTTICYLLIGKRINQNLNYALQTEKQTLKKHKFKLILQLILVTIVYNLDFMLSYLTMILNLVIEYKRSPVMDTLVILTKHMSIALNPLIIISFQPIIHHEYLCIIVKAKAKFYAKIKTIWSLISNKK